MNKINNKNNVITWFEIPVNDLDRAQKFYEQILSIEMIRRKDGINDAAFFPFNPNVAQANSNRVTGVLAKSQNLQPSGQGTVVYINANPDIQTVLDKVEATGGKIIVSRRKIETGNDKVEAGFVAVIVDSEGNRVGLSAAF
ncbi:VOC family protein [Vibrio sp. D404a]|uniref:VOC family protein n=1 Tax=unclassified Vibrio TaxID=2614977 RepID=UPI002554BB2D|nr:MULTISPECIES: VOC family protein [unclassified Vibrio]MDK9735951.1 VOC family protein [Vibrio sp. D404a]MDK9797883.1 VOC family protein [Vibrio sp. D449a]